MPSTYPRYKAAACHVASCFNDAQATTEKTVSLIAEAAKGGAALVAFPEGFLPGFPVWAALRAPIENHEFFRRLVAEAVLIDGPEITKVREAARRHGVMVSLGFTEGTRASVGCIWNSNVLIGPDGAVLNHHRKLVPTYFEKLVWANGDARGLRVVDTDLGRIGMLICGENTNPLSRYALMADGEQVHISSYPPFWPTRPPSENGAYDLRRAIEIRAGAHAFEAKVHNIVSSAVADEAMLEAVAKGDRKVREIMEQSPKGVSVILDPAGEAISDIASGDEQIIYAEIDTARSVEVKQFHDVTGYYNRFDIFDLTVDRTPREPAHFLDAERPAAPALADERGAARQGIPSAGVPSADVPVALEAVGALEQAVGARPRRD